MKRVITRLLLNAVAVVTAVAVVKEVRTPAEDRTGHGVALGVPYDFRPPTIARIQDAWWNPSDPRLLTPKAIGIGWTVNLARLFRPSA